ncbi:hypothetical protein FQN49_008238, partial [Arthroderma sp. PD_2]
MRGRRQRNCNLSISAESDDNAASDNSLEVDCHENGRRACSEGEPDDEPDDEPDAKRRRTLPART